MDERRYVGSRRRQRWALYKFDLSSIPGGATINLAQLRIYHTGGNGGGGNGDVSTILTHAWSEAPPTTIIPGATAGVSLAHPSGTNTGASQNATGGGTAPLQKAGHESNDQFFDIGVDAGSSDRPFLRPQRHGLPCLDVTSHVQEWVNGTKPQLRLGT